MAGMGRPLGIGIAGAGVIGHVHARALAELDQARLIAVAEPNATIGQDFAASHRLDWHPTLDDLVERPDIDAVVLATPSGLHAEQAIRAAQAGKHVITEKPMAITLESADRMIVACREAGVALAVIFQYRVSRDVRRLKRAIEAGLLGQPLLGNALVHWHRTQEYYDTGGWRGTWSLDGGGALMNQSVHTIDLLNWMLGPTVSVTAETGTIAHRMEAEDIASAAVRFASGALGTIQATTAAPEDWPARLEIIGTAGRAVLEADRLARWEATTEIADAALLTESDLMLSEGWTPDEAFGAAHQRQLRAIIAAIQAGQTPPVPGDEARQAVEIILAIYRSARGGHRVDLPLTSDRLAAVPPVAPAGDQK
jgi:predicted dehydrogenase